MNLAKDIFTNERFGLITGSRCSPLVPKKSADVGQRTLAKQLAKEVVFEFYDEQSTWQTEHGQINEEFAMDHFMTYYDDSIKKGRWIKKGEIGGSTDAESKEYGVDFKCPTTLEGWLNNCYEGVKTEYYNQCQLYMILTDKDKWLVCNYLIETQRMNDNGIRYPIEEVKRMIIQEVKRDNEWIEKFNENLPKVVEMRNEYISILKSKFN